LGHSDAPIRQSDAARCLLFNTTCSSFTEDSISSAITATDSGRHNANRTSHIIGYLIERLASFDRLGSDHAVHRDQFSGSGIMRFRRFRQAACWSFPRQFLVSSLMKAAEPAASRGALKAAAPSLKTSGRF
jgi:hypothetical protein